MPIGRRHADSSHPGKRRVGRKNDVAKWDKVSELLGAEDGCGFSRVGYQQKQEKKMCMLTTSGVKVASRVTSGLVA